MKRHFIVMLIVMCSAASASAQAPTGLEGKWEGALVVGPNQLRIVLNVSKASDGLYLGIMMSPDQGNVPISVDKIEQNGDSVRLEVKAVNGLFQGSISDDKTKLKGTWSQGGPTIPLELTRTAAVADAPKPPDPAAVAAAAANNPFGIPVEMKVPIPPTAFQA